MTTTDTNNQIKPESEFQAALHCKCPKCRRGEMFTSSIFNIFGQKMHATCPWCNFRFEIEPGYFYVAMFVSYAMIVAEMVTLALGTYILSHSDSPWVYVGILLGGTLLLSPFNFRYSRVILLYWLTPKLHYDPERAKKPYNADRSH